MSYLTLKQVDHAVSVIIPARNEASRIGKVVQGAIHQADEVIVIDDGSSDETADIAKSAGARVISQPGFGYISAIKRGFHVASGDVFVTMDGDGEHIAEEIPLITQPILEDRADLVLGRRQHVARISERLIGLITRLRVSVHDTGTGFRALRRNIALNLEFQGICICGTSVLEAYHLGARIIEVPITLRSISKRRSVAWKHILQMAYVVKMLCKSDSNRQSKPVPHSRDPHGDSYFWTG